MQERLSVLGGATFLGLGSFRLWNPGILSMRTGCENCCASEGYPTRERPLAKRPSLPLIVFLPTRLAAGLPISRPVVSYCGPQ
jgi:hypothetical protein